MSGQIFISYRREESRWSARSLHDRLSMHFDRNQIFMDIEAIALGEDFVKAIETTVAKCDVLIAVIGANWLTSKDRQGVRRLDNPGDFVRMEIATALSRDIRVIPVLVDGALMPFATELPDDLKPLVRRNALQISDTSFDGDCQRLIATIRQVLEEAAAKEQEREKNRLDAERREREEKERQEAEHRESEATERLEAERLRKKEQERQETEPQSPPPGLAPLTSPAKRKLLPVVGIMTLLALAIGLAVGTANYLRSRHPEPKQITSEVATPQQTPLPQPSQSPEQTPLPEPPQAPSTPGDWAYFGRRNGNGWDEVFFKDQTRDPVSTPDVGDIVIATGTVTIRKGPIQFINSNWVNQKSTGIIRPGQRLTVLEVKFILDVYVWIRLSGGTGSREGTGG
jgi:hypothetical protein